MRHELDAKLIRSGIPLYIGKKNIFLMNIPGRGKFE
jgi:hypothetical protein